MLFSIVIPSRREVKWPSNCLDFFSRLFMIFLHNMKKEQVKSRGSKHPSIPWSQFFVLCCVLKDIIYLREVHQLANPRKHIRNFNWYGRWTIWTAEIIQLKNNDLSINFLTRKGIIIIIHYWLHIKPCCVWNKLEWIDRCSLFFL